LSPLPIRHISASTPVIALYRLWLAVPLTMLVAAAAGSPLTLAITRRAVLGGVLFGTSIGFGFAAFRATSVANASLIPALQPVLVVLVASRLFGERLLARNLALGAVSVVGVATVVLGAGHSSGASTWGDLLAFGNLLGFTGYFLEMKRVRTDNVPATPLLAGVILVAAIVFTPYALLAGGDLGAIGGWDWLWVAFLAVVPGTVGHGLMTWAQRHVDVTVSSLISLLNPVVASVGAWLVFSEALAPVQIVGVGLVLAGLAGVVVASPKAVAAVEGEAPE
jgi:drug/metabolite transporter (DMT)-like permease